MNQTIWHNLSWPEVARKLNSDSKQGLSEEEVQKRQKQFGKNLLPEEKPLSRLRIFLDQFRSPLIYILVIAGILAIIFPEEENGFLARYSDAIVIFAAVILNTIVGFFQENKASQALKQLKKVVTIEAKVIREGNPRVIDAKELVSGDIFELKAGDKVPADGRIIESHNLKTNEMALTGEWLPAKKHSEILPRGTPMADRDNIVYMGTLAEDGKAKAIVIETGLNTEMGKVALMLKETKEEKTPYQKKLANFSRIIGIVISIICILIFFEGLITKKDPLEMFRTAVAVAVAAIPEGLPVAMTAILALGMQRILKRQGLVRKLIAAETLGSTSIIATDKTATLTEGKMKVSNILTPSKILTNKKDENSKLAIKIAALCADAFIENPEASKENWILRGRATDKALLEAGIELGFDKREFENKEPELEQLPFDPVYKYSATLRKISNTENILYVLGAPEKILKISKYLNINGKAELLSEEKSKKLKEKFENLASKGQRVLATAYKKASSIQHPVSSLKLENLVNELTFVGFITLHDPLRKEVKEAIKVCQQAGMMPIIVTGDHKLTAKAVAEELGFKIKEENMLEGKDLDRLSDREFDDVLKQIRIYARVEPKHKMKIIGAWQEKGEVVAMTGDGINDAPALKKADIGVALGSGTDVAKEVSDLVLLPDSFNIIVAAIEEGRAIIDNIRKVITYLLSDSFSEVVLIGGALLFGFPLPILPVQILWVNLIEDGLPDISLAFEPKEDDLMQKKPQGRGIPLLNQEMKFLIFIIGFFTDFLLLGLFFWLIKYSNYELIHIRSIIFAGLALNSLFYVFSCKSLRKNLWHINPFSNKFLVIAVLTGIIMLILAVYNPFFQGLLKTAPLNFNDWLILLVMSIIEITLIEITKWHFIVKKEV